MSILEQFGSFVAHFRSEGLPAEVRETVRLHMVDTVGAWVAATTTPEGRALLALKKSMRGRPGLEGYGESLLERTMLRCAMVRLSEVDDIHLSSLTTPGSVIVPTALTIAHALGGVASERIADAIAVGYEAMIRLGMGLGGPRILYRGIWPTYFVAPFGAAATAAHLLGLSEVQATHALGMALTAASPGVGHQDGPTTSRWISLGHAARSGAWAALAAQQGFRSDPGILESNFFPSIYNITLDLQAFTQGLGEPTGIMSTSFKPWCAARQTMAATQAMKEMVETGIALAAIDEITAFVPGLQVKMIDHGVMPGDRISHLTSLPYQMALAAFQSDAGFDISQVPTELSDEICAFMSKVRVETDDRLLAYYPAQWAARVVVSAASKQCEKLVTCVPGDPERPFDQPQVTAKFLGVVTPAVGAQTAERFLNLAFAALEGNGPATLLNAIDQHTSN